MIFPFPSFGFRVMSRIPTSISPQCSGQIHSKWRSGNVWLWNGVLLVEREKPLYIVISRTSVDEEEKKANYYICSRSFWRMSECCCCCCWLVVVLTLLRLSSNIGYGVRSRPHCFRDAVQTHCGDLQTQNEMVFIGFFFRVRFCWWCLK